MNILITGATGFIGSRLATHCLRDGHLVRVLGQNRNPAEKQNTRLLEEQGAEVFIASVTDRESLREPMDGSDLVFHLAAAQHEANVPDRHFWNVNVEGTRNMLEASLEARVGRFVHGSSIGVYGWTPGQVVGDDSPLEPDNIYGVTKLAGEKVVREYEQRLDCVILRIAETYGPGDRRLVKFFRGVKKGRFPVIGRGDNLHHLVYIDDLIEGCLLAATVEPARSGVFVLAGDTAVTTREMIETVARLYGASPPRLRIPLGPMLGAAAVMQAVLRPLGIQPPLHPRRMNFYRKSFRFSMEPARSTLGYAPSTDFRTGATQTADWYRKQDLVT